MMVSIKEARRNVAADRGFGLQNNIKTARSLWAKVPNFMTTATAVSPFETFDFTQAGGQIRSMWTRRKV